MKMVTVSSLFLCWFCLYCMSTTANALQLKTSPEEISSGLTESLTVNCTYTRDDDHSITVLISYFIYRQNDNSTSDIGEELASINSYVHHVINIKPEYNSSYGTISSDGVSYLELTWLYPTEAQSGVYTCKAQGIDDFGRVVDITKQATVTSRLPGRDEILARIKEINENLKNVDQKYSDLYSSLSGNFHQFSGSQSSHDNYVNNTLASLETLRQEFYPIVGLLEQSLFFPFNLTFGGHIYKVLRAPVWGGDDAVALCESYGATLLEIDDVEEYQAVKHFLNEHPRLTAISIGGRRVNNRWVKQYTDVSMYEQRALMTPLTNSVTYDCLILTNSPDWDMESASCKEIRLIPSYRQVNAICESKV